MSHFGDFIRETSASSETGPKVAKSSAPESSVEFSAGSGNEEIISYTTEFFVTRTGVLE